MMTKEEREQVLEDGALELARELIELARMEICTLRTSNTVKEQVMADLEAKVAWYSYQSEPF